MRLQPQAIKKRLSVSERIGRFFSGIADFSVALEAIGVVFSLLIGLGVLGFVGFSWLSHFLQSGHFLLAGLVALVLIPISLAAFARSYTAIAVLLGAAAICGVAFLSGAGNLLLP